MGTLRRECLDHVLIYGERHLQRTLTVYARHYDEHRPHQSREQRPPLHEPGQPIDVTARIKHRQVVHGLISEYRRAARWAQKHQLRASVRVLARYRRNSMSRREPTCSAGPGAAQFRVIIASGSSGSGQPAVRNSPSAASSSSRSAAATI
jgi:hypothetical protein